MTATMPRTDQIASDDHGCHVGAAQTPNSDYCSRGTQAQPVAVGLLLLADQTPIDTQDPGVGEAHSPEQASVRTDPISNSPVRAPLSATDQISCVPQGSAVGGGSTSPATICRPLSMGHASPGIQISVTDHGELDTQERVVGGALTPPAPAEDAATPIHRAPVLADPLLELSAAVLDDLERVKIANENRLRQLTRSTEDVDGEERGFGLTLDHPDVARLAALVDALGKAEHQAQLNLKRLMRRHPLGKWVAETKGVGEQQAARLLASIGDPYWNDLHNRPRLLSELRSYVGYGDASAQVLKRGTKANWNATARKRLWLIADKIVMVGGPYRLVYDESRTHYADAVHSQPCARCGPKGKPALAGSPLSDGHKHARARRAVAKSVLADLWRESKRLHELPGDQRMVDTQGFHVAGAPNSSADQTIGDAHGATVSGGPFPPSTNNESITQGTAVDGGST